MLRRVLALLLILTLTSFSLTCHTVRKESATKIPEWNQEDVKVVSLQKTSGNRVVFLKERPGRLQGKSIVGTSAAMVRELEIEQEDVSQIRRGGGNEILSLVTIDGKTYYDGILLSEYEGKYRINAYPEVSIPVAEVDVLWVEKLDQTRTLLVIVGIAGAIALAIIGINSLNSESSSSSKQNESCPFIYSFNGERFLFDAEPYGGAICEGLKRTDWSNLEYLREASGQYKILISNELNETQYTDEVKLVVVDHPKNTRIATDGFGGIHSVSNPIVPIRAWSGTGGDLTHLVKDRDRAFWNAGTRSRNPENQEDLRDELIFEFPKPPGAHMAKLLVNGCTTFWGSLIAKRFLELQGTGISEWYREVNDHGPALSRTLNWYIREELYLLKVHIETPQGWQTRGAIFGGGPFVSKDKIYVLDISDVPGEKLRIKLTPPANFWMFDHVAVDYTDDPPIRTTVLDAQRAVDQDQRDVTELLAAIDDRYLVMPKIGDSAELVFTAPPLNSESKRSVLLKATGFYDIHLDATGEPQPEILERLRSEPGFTVQFALKEYQREVTKSLNEPSR